MSDSGRRAEIIGWGMYAPERVVTNDDLSHVLDTSDQWIRERTGIERRHWAGAGQATAAMAIAAARDALSVADADPHDIGLVLVATMTPDYPMPSTACLVQDALGAIHAGALDMNAGCSGFVYALTVASSAIVSGEQDMVLVIGAETMTSMVDMQDRSTAVLFGDGAGAVLLRVSEGPAGVLATWLGADGSGGDMLMVAAGGSALPASADTIANRLHYLNMEGNQVFRFATRIVPRAIEQVVSRAGLEMDDVDWIIPHQANTRIIEAAAKRLGVDASRFYLNLQEYGNTSAASIPIALCEAVRNGSVQPGQNLVLVGFGAGLTWASALLKWGPSVREAKAVFYRRWWRWLVYSTAAANTRWRRLSRVAIDRIWRLTTGRGHSGEDQPD
ncbi:MAG: beta-ketoacyl-ACP synthase III [Anaerolineae bacterium]